jgi:hypothetical protein
MRQLRSFRIDAYLLRGGVLNARPAFREACRRYSARPLTFPGTGLTSAYPSRYRRPLLLGPSFSSTAYSRLPTLTRAIEGCPVPAEGVSIGRDFRVTLYAGLSFEWRDVRRGDTAAQPFPFGPAAQPLGRFFMTTPQSVFTCVTHSHRLGASRLSASR